MTMPPIDLRSDTVTRPTAAMRRAIADAEVGDDLLDGDPTVRRLEAHVAELLGKERALFFPTGTMANQAALWLLAERGTEAFVDPTCHLVDWEHAAASSLVGVQLRPVASRRGASVMDADGLADVASMHAEHASVVCFENTHNGAGGVVTSAERFDALVAVARAHRLPVHLDGARLWNAAVAAGESEARLAAGADTVMVSFSKGLGAPVGAALVGAAEPLADAKRVRRRLGGALRQSGILAAAALHGVEHHRARLADDHARARALADAIDGAGGARVVPPQTNIVMIDLPSASASTVVQQAAVAGVRVSFWTPTRVRAVTHLDVDDAAVGTAGRVLARVLARVLEGR